MLRYLVCLALLLTACESRQGGAEPSSTGAAKAEPLKAAPKPAEAKAPAAPAAASDDKPAAPATASDDKAGGGHPALLDPAQAAETAPAKYTVKLHTTKGDILVDVEREWAPLGADRFYNLVKIGYYDGSAFFRVIEGFMAQGGLNGDPKVDAAWRRARIEDDPVTQSNVRGMVTFATSGRDSRVNQFYINLADNQRLDGMGFAPFGKVRDMAVVDQLHAGYGEGAPRGRGPMQARINAEGNAYLKRDFPELDYIESATLVE